MVSSPGKIGLQGQARQAGQVGPGADFEARVGPRDAAVKVPLRMTGSFQAGL